MENISNYENFPKNIFKGTLKLLIAGYLHETCCCVDICCLCSG